jgi:hypothetical protein
MSLLEKNVLDLSDEEAEKAGDEMSAAKADWYSDVSPYIEKDSDIEITKDKNINEALKYKKVIAFNAGHEAANIKYDEKSYKYKVHLSNYNGESYKDFSKNELVQYLKENNYINFYDNNMKKICGKDEKENVIEAKNHNKSKRKSSYEMEM